MKTARAMARRSGCPISLALEIFGDTWSLLIVRDLMFKGLDTFNQFQTAGEGIATNILTDRLGRLESAGIVAKRDSETDARRYHYFLTEKGIDLAPALVEIVLWSARHEKTDAPAEVLRQMQSQKARFLAGVRQQWRQKAGRNRGAPMQRA
jgi:DNA-binding HxlR family transcriptional regulator